MQKRKECNDKTKHYVDKEELRSEVSKCQKEGVVSEELAMMFIKMVDGVAHRFSNLRYYNIIEDAKGDCLELLLKKYNNFDPERKTSSFAFFTTIIYRHFQYQTTRAKRHKERKDNLNQKVIDFLEEREGRR